MKPRYWLSPVLVGLIGVAACDSLFGPDLVPTTLTILDGDAQVDTVDAAISPLVVEVRDQEARLIEGARVQWVVVEGEASVTPAASATDRDGTASAAVTLGTRAGPVEVKASAGSGLTATFSLTAVPDRPALVAPAVDSVSLDALGDTVRVEAEVFDRHGNAVPDAELTWSTSDSALVGLGENGLIRSIAPGSATVRIRSDTATTGIPVTITQTPASVTITPTDALLTAIEDTEPLTAAAYDRNGHAIEEATFDWSSDNPEVATVSASGVITAAGPGETSITAAAGEATATATAKVEQEVDRVVLQVPSDTLRESGDTLRATATARDRNGYAIADVSFVWESSRSSLVAVDGSGLLTAGSGRGDARITARADGVEDRKTVTRIPYGVLVLTFDDAYEDVYTRVLPILQKHGIAANIALPTGWVGQTINGVKRLSGAQVRELHDAGWSIVPHTVDHPDLTQISDAEVDRQLRKSQQWVRDRGYRGSSVFIVPYHRWYEDEREAVRKYFDAARGWGTDHSRHGGMRDWPAPDPIMLTSIPGDSYFRTNDGRQQMEALWAEAVSKGKFVGTFFHRIDAPDAAALEQVIERLVAYKAHIRTYAELFE